MLRILVDTRENLPYLFTGYDVDVEASTLSVGDYSLPGFVDRVSLERKSLDDLIGCLTTGRERFEKELRRARPYELFAVVVEASLADIAQGKYTSDMKPQSALQSILAFTIRYGTNFIWAENRQGGEYVTHGLLSKYLREIGKRYELAGKGQTEREKAA